MPAYTNATARPRQELGAVIREGQGINKLNIHSQILPPLAVNKRTVHLVKAKIANTQLARILDDYFITAPGADIERMTAVLNDDSFTVTIRKREIQVPDEVEMDYSDYLSVEALYSQQAADSVELTTEYLTAAAIMNATTFGAGTPAIADYTAANLLNNTIDLIGDIYAATERGLDVGELYDTVVIPSLVYKRARRCTKVANYVVSQLGKGYEVNQSNLQAALADVGIRKVLIGSSIYNAQADGVAISSSATMTKIWPVTYIWVGSTGDTAAAQNDGFSTIQGVGVNAFWENYTPSGGYGVDTYREEKTESNIVRAKTSKAPYIANANAGTLITTAYA